ncbi:MAG: arginine--tRNA ligase, partial [Solobacterium sp.]|nr:arginine--tRNA ligase [Solobacterium sp.]
MSEVEKKIEQVIFESVKSVFEIDAPEGSITVETPKDKKMGDYASSVAMRLAKVLHKSPMQIAEALITSLQEGLKEEVKAIEVANPGFINFRLSEGNLTSHINKIIEAGEDYGKNDSGNRQKILVEWVSANPTGDLHCGHARNAAWGDCICRALEASDYDVLREYYVNDAGNQIVNLGKSLEARYFEYFGKDFSLPEDGYHGEDVKEIAIEIAKDEGDKWLTATDEERLNYFMQVGKQKEL